MANTRPRIAWNGNTNLFVKDDADQVDPKLEVDETADTDTEETDESPANGKDDPGEKMISQDQLDKILQKRLKRQEDQLMKKFADYDERVAESENYRKLQDEKSTDAERWEREKSKLLADLQSRDTKLATLERATLVADLATDANLPKSFWKRVQGDSEEDIAADIADIVKDLGLDKDRDESKGTPKKSPANRPGTTFGGGGEGEDPDPDTDAIVAKIPRGPQIRVSR